MKYEEENSRFLLPSIQDPKDSNNRPKQKWWQLPRLTVVCNLSIISLFLTITTITNTDALASTDLDENRELNSTENTIASKDESQSNNNITSYLRIGKQDTSEKNYNNYFDQASPNSSILHPYYPYLSSTYSPTLDPYTYYPYYPHLQQYPSFPPFTHRSSSSGPHSSDSIPSLSPFSSTYNPRGSLLLPPPPPLAVPLNLFQLPQNPYETNQRLPELQQQQQNLLFKSSPKQEVEQYPKLISSWFPSLPASECEGVFEFTIEGMANLDGKNMKSGDHKITLKLSSESPDSVSGILWVDKKSSQDKGHEFDVRETFNNCRVITASSSPALSESQFEDPFTFSPSPLSSAPSTEDHEDLSLSKIEDEEYRDQDDDDNNDNAADDEDRETTIAALE